MTELEKRAKELSPTDIKKMTRLYSRSELAREEALMLLIAKNGYSQKDAESSYLTAEIEKGKIRNNLA